jgi:glutaredoxin-related protein
MKYYHLFIKTNCIFCKKAISLLEKNNIPFVATACDKSDDFVKSIKKYYNWQTVPIIVEENLDENLKLVDWNLVGGYTELRKIIDCESPTNI